jgi:hypothetical protein
MWEIKEWDYNLLGSVVIVPLKAALQVSAMEIQWVHGFQVYFHSWWDFFFLESQLSWEGEYTELWMSK